MIGPGIRIKGEVSGEEDLLVQGAVEGSIRLAGNQLIVGESGQVNADVQAKTVKIDGAVSGDIVATENVVISKLGNVQGNIVAPRVSLEDGAVFKGSIDMNPAETAGKARPVVAASPEPAKIPTPENKGPQLDLKHG